MKKTFLALAMMAVASFASAASLTWGYGDAYLYVAKASDSKAVQASSFSDAISADAAFVLVYLGQSATLDISKVTASDVVASIAYGSTNDGWDDYASTASTSFVVDPDVYSVGDHFAVAFFDGSKYSSIFTVTDYDEGTIGGTLANVVTITDTTPTASFAVYGSDGAPKDSYGIGMAGVSVPEPSVALLGLLGIGMLIKRRRA